MDIKINRKPNSESIIRYFVDKIYGQQGDIDKLTAIKSGIRIASGDYDEYIKTIISKLESLQRYIDDDGWEGKSEGGHYVLWEDIENLIKEIEKE